MKSPEQANPYIQNIQKVDSWFPRAEREQDAEQGEGRVGEEKVGDRNRVGEWGVGMGFLLGVMKMF